MLPLTKRMVARFRATLLTQDAGGACYPLRVTHKNAFQPMLALAGCLQRSSANIKPLHNNTHPAALNTSRLHKPTLHVTPTYFGGLPAAPARPASCNCTTRHTAHCRTCHHHLKCPTTSNTTHFSRPACSASSAGIKPMHSNMHPSKASISHLTKPQTTSSVTCLQRQLRQQHAAAQQHAPHFAGLTVTLSTAKPQAASLTLAGLPAAPAPPASSRSTTTRTRPDSALHQPNCISQTSSSMLYTTHFGRPACSASSASITLAPGSFS
jgi:hypothetical protein